MKLIPIYNRYKELLFNAKLDDDDYERLFKYKWHATYSLKANNKVAYYARRTEKINGKDEYFYMHREIMGVYEKEIIIDHINHDTTDNQKNNLRIATRSENTKNKTPKGKDITFQRIIPKYEGKDKIQIGRNLFTLIDEEDYDLLSKYNWHGDKQISGDYYAVCRPKEGARIYMHRLLTKCPEGMVVDHIDGNKLNNKKSNLRNCTVSQNSMNKKSKTNSTSKYLGVSKCPTKYIYKGVCKIYYYWRVTIKVGNKKMTLKSFPFTSDGEIDAAKTYDEAAKKYFGEFANLNFKT